MNTPTCSYPVLCMHSVKSINKWGEYLTDHGARLAKVKKWPIKFLVSASCKNRYETANYLEGSGFLNQRMPL